MTITVEDGTIIPDANSYVTVGEFTAYAAARNIVLPADDEAKEALLIKAMDYIEMYDLRYRGVRYDTEQALSWPRVYSYVRTGIPAALKKLQMVLAVVSMSTDLLPVVTGSSQAITRETVGPITLEYTDESNSAPSIPEAQMLMNSLFGNSGQLRVIRG